MWIAEWLGKKGGGDNISFKNLYVYLFKNRNNYLFFVKFIEKENREGKFLFLFFELSLFYL